MPDYSVISQIGSAPGEALAQGVSRGFQLKDLVNQTTLSSMDVRKAQKQEEQSNFLSGLSKEYDITNPEQASKAASKAAKAGYPDLATGVLKQSQSLQLGQAQANEARFQAGQQAIGYVDDGVQRILAGVAAQTQSPDGKPLLTPQGTEKYDSKTKDAMTVAGVLKFQKDLQDDTTLSPESKKMALDTVNKYLAGGQPITYDGIQQVSRQTKTGREAFMKEIERRNKLSEIETREGTLHEKIRHDQAQEAAAKTKADASAKGFDEQESELLASLADKNVSLPAGLRSQAQIRSTIQGLLKKHADLSPDEIAEGIKSGKLKLAAETKGAQTAGTQIGKVALAANELNTFGDQTLEASNAVPRGKFVPYNQLVQMGDTKISDPALLRFKTKMQALENAYNQLAARSGTDVEKRAHIHELFNTANSPEAVQTLIKALKEESVGAREAADATIAETSGTGAIPGAKAPAGGPKVGAVEGGYRFKGGDPANPASWEKAGGG